MRERRYQAGIFVLILHLGAVHMDPHGSIFLGWGMNEVQWKDGLGEKRTKERLTEPYQVNQ